MDKTKFRLSDDDTTNPRRKWSFFEVARHIKSHGLKGSLRTAGRTATQRFEWGPSKPSESKTPSSPLAIKLRSPRDLAPPLDTSRPSTQSTIATNLKECSNVRDDDKTQAIFQERTVPQSPIESSVLHAGWWVIRFVASGHPHPNLTSTPSVGDSAVKLSRLEPYNTGADAPGFGARDTGSNSVSTMDSHVSENGGSDVIPRTFGGRKGQADAVSQSTLEDMGNIFNIACQGSGPVTSSGESSRKQGKDRDFGIRHVGCDSGNEQVNLSVVAHEVPSKNSSDIFETNPTGHVPISRQMNATEVVTHLVEHGVTDMSIMLDYSTFDEHPIVTGGSSDVYRGRLKDGTDVAVKVLRFSVHSFSEATENIRDAARELHTWSKCSHPNVLPLLGLVTFRGRIGMVSPWMGEGTMPRYLECIQICEGLSYLHDKGIVHGDLKGTNVLISKDGIPVLTDFGNSTLKDRTLKFTQAGNDSALTLRWSAPEFIKDSGLSLRTKASDIYALGMTIYEAIVGKVPYYGETELQVIITVAMKRIPPKRPDWIRSGQESGDKLWDLLTRCWLWEPEGRPSVAEVLSIMRKIRIEELLT